MEHQNPSKTSQHAFCIANVSRSSAHYLLKVLCMKQLLAGGTFLKIFFNMSVVGSSIWVLKFTHIKKLCLENMKSIFDTCILLSRTLVVVLDSKEITIWFLCVLHASQGCCWLRFLDGRKRARKRPLFYELFLLKKRPNAREARAMMVGSPNSKRPKTTQMRRNCVSSSFLSLRPYSISHNRAVFLVGAMPLFAKLPWAFHFISRCPWFRSKWHTLSGRLESSNQSVYRKIQNRIAKFKRNRQLKQKKIKIRPLFQNSTLYMNSTEWGILNISSTLAEH